MVGAELRRSTGLEYAGSIDADGAALLVACDGQRPLGELVTELAASVGADPADVTPAVLGVVRRLIALGVPRALARRARQSSLALVCFRLHSARLDSPALPLASWLR
jgi:hypothetical protein